MDQMTPLHGWFAELFSRERRRAERQNPCHLVAHYWDGAAPLAHAVRDISSAGLYLFTEQRWYPGTLVMISLQRDGIPETDPDRAITVEAKVVRSGSDGVGLAFALPQKEPAHVTKGVFSGGTDRKTFHRFLKRAQSNSGQALIEYVLMLPLIFLLIINAVNFGGFLYAWVTVSDAARAGADYAILGDSSVGAPGVPTATQITDIITQEASSLPNAASLSVSVCQNNNGTVTTGSGTCTSVPADPEATNFVLTSIDVTYTYQPFIGAFNFPGLGIYTSIPPTTIHRRALMRLLN
jgi:Flp pilus assembly protein TadG